MKLSQLMDKDRLDLLIQEDLIKVNYSNDGEYRTLGYTDKAQYTKGSWDNPEVQICRGLIVDSKDNVVARPYSKFFNYGQPEAYVDFNAPVEVTDKADGSLGILFLDKAGEINVATRGSFNSDQALWATEWLRNHPDTLNAHHPALPNTTILVEIVYPDNRIVLDYGGFEGLILLGSVHIDSGAYMGPQDTASVFEWRGNITTTFNYRTLNEAIEAPPRPNAEGLVVRYLNVDKQVKIKQEDYLKAHAYLTNCTPLQIWRKVREGYILEDFLQEAPDEFIPLVTQYYTELVANMEDIRRRVNSEWDLLQQSLPEDHSRKQLADAAKDNPHSPALFMLADGKDIEPYLLKKVKPSS